MRLPDRRIIDLDDAMLRHAAAIKRGRLKHLPPYVREYPGYYYMEPERRHVIGGIGEIAGYEALGLDYHDIRIVGPKKFGGDLWDLDTPEGTIDFKTTPALGSNPHLIVSDENWPKTEDVDFFVLVQYLEGEKLAVLVGWATRESLGREKSEDWYGNGPCRRLAASELEENWYST